MPLFRLLFEDVVKPVQQDSRLLHIVPNPERAQNSRIGHRRQRTECNKAADAQISVNYLDRSNP